LFALPLGFAHIYDAIKCCLNVMMTVAIAWGSNCQAVSVGTISIKVNASMEDSSSGVEQSPE